MHIGSLLTFSARKFPESTAIVSEEGRRSFAEFERRANRVAAALRGAGLAKGDRVGILFHNGAHFAEVYFGTLKAGLVATPINFRLTGSEMLRILEHARPGALFYGPEFEGTLADIRGELEGIRLFVSPGGAGSAGALEYEDFLTRADAEGPVTEVCEDDGCQLMYTSGTTGRPKGVLLTHRNVLWNLFNTILGREDRPGERAVIAGPLYHTAALNNHFTIQVALGGTGLLIRDFDPEHFLRTIEQERATVVSGAPTLYNLLLQHPGAGRYDVSSVTKCTVGADKLPGEVRKRLLEFFPNIAGVYDIYGCTEAAPCITILSGRDSLRKAGSVGKALPFLEARVVDESGQPLPPGVVGELVCRGPNVMRGYFRDPEATRQALREGWLFTGDLARMDEEKYFYIVDRKKDMIISGGENIYPREIEEVLMSHPAVADAAVVGVPDPLWGESVRAFVALRSGHRIGEREVVDFCRQHLAGYKKPRSVVFMPSIPRNPSGKALKRLLKERSPDRGPDSDGPVIR